jgi:hypothetical protein
MANDPKTPTKLGAKKSVALRLLPSDRMIQMIGLQHKAAIL